jgi:putative alpha-1,2-mannosidase
VARLLFAAASAGAVASQQPLHAIVNTTIGTGGVGYGCGSVPIGPQVPFGAMRLGPDTTEVLPVVGELWLRFEHFGGYAYPDNYIRAFSHT